MNPLNMNPTLSKTYTTYSKRFNLVEDRTPDNTLSLLKTGNLSRTLEQEKKSSQRSIITSHTTVRNYLLKENYDGLINFCKQVIEDDLDQCLEDIGHEFLKATDLKEKLFWCRKYNILDDFNFKALEKFFLGPSEQEKENKEASLTGSLGGKLSQSGGFGTFGRSQTGSKIGPTRSEAYNAIRNLIAYFESQQKRKSDKHLFEPSVSELKKLISETD